MCLVVRQATIISGVITQIITHRLRELTIKIITITTGQETILTIDGKAILRHKAIIIINLIMDIIHNLFNKIHRTTRFLIIIIIINNYHRHRTIQDSKLILTIAVFLLITWDDCQKNTGASETSDRSSKSVISANLSTEPAISANTSTGIPY